MPQQRSRQRVIVRGLRSLAKLPNLMSWEWKQVGEVKSKQQQLFSSDSWCITPLSLLESDFTDRSVQTTDQLRPSSTWFSPDPATGIKCDHLRRACSIQPRNVQELLRKQPCKKSHVLLIVLFLFLNLPLQLISRSLDDSTFTDAIEEIIGYWKLLLFTYSLKKKKKQTTFFERGACFGGDCDREREGCPVKHSNSQPARLTHF